MTPNVDVVVVGGGPVGVLAAKECAELKLKVALVSDSPLGGRAGWDSLVPSKVLIDAAHHWRGAGPPDAEAWAKIQARMRELSEAVHGPEEGELTALGVKLLRGKACFAGPHRMKVRTPGGRDEELGFQAAIVATGSVPNFRDGLRPDGERIFAPRYLNTMPPPPKSLMVVGGGVTGAEMAYAFRALGVQVKWVVAETGLLPRFDREPVEELTAALAARGVEVLSGELAMNLAAGPNGVELARVDGAKVRADAAFIAIGRRADTDGLHLMEAGLDVMGGPIRVDGACRSAVPHVYAAGDVTGPPFVLNKGLAQAWTAARAIAGKSAPEFDARSVIEAVYTHPEISRVGWSLASARQAGLEATAHLLRGKPGLKERLEHHEARGEARGGLLEVVLGPGGELLGATAVHPKAAELITSMAFAVRERARIADAASLFPASPTSVEFAFEALRAAALKH